jgi:hypothetical protein
MQDAGGWSYWVIIDIAAVVVLGLLLAWGVLYARRRRGPRTEQARQDAVENMYDDRERRP